MIRLALIGCGAWGWRYIPAAIEAGNCVVTHVAGVGRSCPAEARRYLDGVQVVANGDLLSVPVDGFVVATPPDKRLLTCCPLLTSHRPVMVEKPLALSLNDADWLVATAENAGVPLLVNHQHLFAPAYEALREHVAGMDGLQVVSFGTGPGPHRSYSSLWDYGPHDVAMVLGLDPAADLATARQFDDLHKLHLVGPMAEAHSYVSNDTPTKMRRFDVFRDGRKIASYDDMTPNKFYVDGSPIAINQDKPLTRSVRAFAEAVRTGKTDWRFGRFGADVVGILDQAQQMLDRQQEARDAHH